MTTEEAIRGLGALATDAEKTAGHVSYLIDPVMIRTVLARLAAVEHERDEMTAYAAFLQAQSTLKQDFSQWSPSEAVEWVRKVASGTYHRLAWRRDERLCLEDCRRAVGLAAAGLGGDEAKGGADG